jgi:hypothetical protein
MRWTEQMAEAIVQLRAIYLSGDFDRYWQFHIDQVRRKRSAPLSPVSLKRGSQRPGMSLPSTRR